MPLNGLIDLPWWGYALAALLLSHITIASVTIFFHRHQAHRSLDLHPLVSHFFRFWLWLTTGNVTREWVAIHRKHHAKVETPQDPHSPQHWGIKKVLWDGVALYRAEAKNAGTISKYGHGAPDDWLERRLYTPHNSRGVLLMLAIDIALFGPIGLTVWAIQMFWIPFFAAGVINGVGHYWGYRNYEVPDASRNVVPWGILIGGEELHNNHHTFPRSAKFSSKWWELDLAWLYIRLLACVGLARVKRIPPRLVLDTAKRQVDFDTVKTIVTARFQVMADFAREVMHRVHREEMKKLDRADRETWRLLKRARRLLTRETLLLDESSRRWLDKVLERSAPLSTVYAMKHRLAAIWRRSAASQETLRHATEEWCRQAEDTGIQALREFSQKLRSYRLAFAGA